MTKCDLHVHSADSSTIIPLKFTRMVGVRECYSSVEDIYRTAKERGMDFVTITDHNNIGLSLRLAELHPEDSFSGCEYAVKATEEGHIVDVLCYNQKIEQHNELLKIKNKALLPEFVAYLKKNNLPHILAHPAESMNPKIKITPELLLSWIDLFEVIETKNGDLQRVNDIAEMCVDFRNKYRKPEEKKKAKTGGSDAHTLDSIARAYTVADNAKTKDEFLEALLNGKVRPEGEIGSYESFKESIYHGVEAYKKYELERMHELIEIEKQKWRNSRILSAMPFARWFVPQIAGFMRYSNRNLAKVIGMALLPVLKGFLPQTIAANVKAKTEKESSILEKKCIDYLIKEEYADAYRYYEYVENLRAKYMEQVKPEHYYMPKITSRIIMYLQKKLGLASADYDKRDYD